MMSVQVSQEWAQEWAQEMSARVIYLWVAMHGRMLFEATWHAGMTVESFQASLGYNGDELQGLAYGDDQRATLHVTWVEQGLLHVRSLSDGDRFRVTPPTGQVSVIAS